MKIKIDETFIKAIHKENFKDPNDPRKNELKKKDKI